MKKTARGFTLVELLVVIAIIAILAAVVVLIINPLELTRRGRDSARLQDLNNIQNAINVAVQEATGSGTASILCVGGFTSGAGSNGSVCREGSNGGGRASDGTGWVKVNLGAQSAVSVPTLPVDPTNNATYHYTYCSDGNTWEIDTALESTKEASKMTNDGGSDPVLYEAGSSPSYVLINTSGTNYCTY